MPTTRKPRKKATTQIGRTILVKQRQRLAREQATLGEQLVAESQQRRKIQENQVRHVKPEEIAVTRGIVRRVAGVLASEDLDVRIVATADRKMKAYTDYTTITVKYRMHDDVRLLAATLRGLIYHEGGHCRFTFPLRNLASAATGSFTIDNEIHAAWNLLEDQRMETAVVSDSPRKAAYLTPTVITEMVSNVNQAAANYPLLIWRKYLPKHIREGARRMFVLRHGAQGEEYAQAFERIVTSYVLATDIPTMWKAVIDCRDMLRVIHPLAYNLLNAGHEWQNAKSTNDLDENVLVIPLDPTMIDDEPGEPAPKDEEEEVIDLTDPETALHLSEVWIALCTGGKFDPRIVYTVPNPSQSEQEEDDNGSYNIDPDNDAKSTPDDTGKEFADKNEKPTSSEGGAEGEHSNTGLRDDIDYRPDEELTDEDLTKALAEAEEERDSDYLLDGDEKAYADALDNRVSNLMPYQGGVSQDIEATAQADNLAEELEQAFHAATMARAPAWVEQQKRGILNPLRYETRQPGDTEFFKAWVDTDQPGLNIAVSVLLDYSGSMDWKMKELAQAGYASKLACQRLNIPCTVVLWDTNATVLWDAQETVSHLPTVVAQGGTDPTVALADLDTQRYEKAQHIVLILTDGQWSGARPGWLASYLGESGRYFIGLGFGGYNMAANLKSYGCDEAYNIENLMDIPRYLEQTLADLA